MQNRLYSLALAFCLVTSCAMAATTITIPGSSNIFGAGHAAPPSSPTTAWNLAHLPDSGPGIVPPGVNFTPQPYLVLHFQSIVGSGPHSGVAYNGGGQYAGPEGFSNVIGENNALVNTNVSSMAGISGIFKTNRVLFLVGVFLNNNEPSGAAPPNLDATSADNQLNFAPLLGQTFYIGDGFTNTGVRQNFVVPNTASRLYLGFADSWLFDGAPSWFSDNVGQLTATFDFEGPPGVPEPSTVWLLALPLAGIVYGVRRRRVS